MVAPKEDAMAHVAFVLGWKGFVNIIVQMPGVAAQTRQDDC